MGTGHGIEGIGQAVYDIPDGIIRYGTGGTMYGA
jgi:hypothetical protein